jgi:hypothetical protein
MAGMTPVQSLNDGWINPQKPENQWPKPAYFHATADIRQPTAPEQAATAHLFSNSLTIAHQFYSRQVSIHEAGVYFLDDFTGHRKMQLVTDDGLQADARSVSFLMRRADDSAD